MSDNILKTDASKVGYFLYMQEHYKNNHGIILDSECRENECDAIFTIEYEDNILTKCKSIDEAESYIEGFLAGLEAE